MMTFHMFRLQWHRDQGAWGCSSVPNMCLAPSVDQFFEVVFHSDDQICVFFASIHTLVWVWTKCLTTSGME